MNMKALLFCAALLANIGQATEVKLSLLEESTQKTRHYEFDVTTSALKSLRSASGETVQQTAIYTARDRYLFAGDKKIAGADDLLYQCHIDDCDLVVVRDEYNSYSNPMWALFAFSGHPVQVSKIVILKIVDGKLKTKREIIRKASSYHWRVSVWSGRPNKSPEPTAVGAGRSAVAVHVAGRRWLSFLR
jgi:hypothetical protein